MSREHAPGLHPHKVNEEGSDVSTITPCLWFDGQAQEAAGFYVSVFPNSRITKVSKYPGDAPSAQAGQVMTVEFELDGQTFTGLNGGPQFTFTEAISLQVPCDSQEDVDHYWDGLAADGGEHGPCGWLKDRFGLSWQVFPRRLTELITESDPETAERVFAAMMEMSKIDVAALEEAAAGGAPV